jgi:hypothetical protein
MRVGLETPRCRRLLMGIELSCLFGYVEVVERPIRRPGFRRFTEAGTFVAHGTTTDASGGLPQHTSLLDKDDGVPSSSQLVV